VVLPGPPPRLDEVPAGKALVCVGDQGAYEAAGYIITEQELALRTDPVDTSPKAWLLMDRATVDRLCPGVAEDGESWQASPECDAQAAAHTGNLLPVARASCWVLRRDARLREYAAALDGDGPRMDPAGWPAEVRPEYIAAADLTAIAEHLEAWAEHDWIAVIDLSPERGHLAGPLRPFPETPAG
jgi:hypothetical protein